MGIWLIVTIWMLLAGVFALAIGSAAARPIPQLGANVEKHNFSNCETEMETPMKPSLAHKLLGALLLGGLLSSTSASDARPPTQHAERGIIQTVDHAANSFTIISGKEAAKRTFIWSNSTSFRQKSPQPDASWISRLFSLGEKTTADSLQPGRSVRFHYRKELGRLVVRGVTILAALGQSCGCCTRSTSATTLTDSGHADHSSRQSSCH